MLHGSQQWKGTAVSHRFPLAAPSFCTTQQHPQESRHVPDLHRRHEVVAVVTHSPGMCQRVSVPVREKCPLSHRWTCQRRLAAQRCGQSATGAPELAGTALQYRYLFQGPAIMVEDYSPACSSGQIFPDVIPMIGTHCTTKMATETLHMLACMCMTNLPTSCTIPVWL